MFFTDEERKLLQEIQSSGGLDFSYKGGEEYSIGDDTFKKFDRSTAIRLLPDLTEKFASLDNEEGRDIAKALTGVLDANITQEENYQRDSRLDAVGRGVGTAPTGITSLFGLTDLANQALGFVPGIGKRGIFGREEGIYPIPPEDYIFGREYQNKKLQDLTGLGYGSLSDVPTELMPYYKGGQFAGDAFSISNKIRALMAGYAKLFPQSYTGQVSRGVANPNLAPGMFDDIIKMELTRPYFSQFLNLGSSTMMGLSEGYGQKEDLTDLQRFLLNTGAGLAGGLTVGFTDALKGIMTPPKYLIYDPAKKIYQTKIKPRTDKMKGSLESKVDTDKPWSTPKDTVMNYGVNTIDSIKDNLSWASLRLKKMWHGEKLTDEDIMVYLQKILERELNKGVRKDYIKEYKTNLDNQLTAGNITRDEYNIALKEATEYADIRLVDQVKKNMQAKEQEIKEIENLVTNGKISRQQADEDIQIIKDSLMTPTTVTGPRGDVLKGIATKRYEESMDYRETFDNVLTNMFNRTVDDINRFTKGGGDVKDLPLFIKQTYNTLEEQISAIIKKGIDDVDEAYKGLGDKRSLSNALVSRIRYYDKALNKEVSKLYAPLETYMKNTPITNLDESTTVINNLKNSGRILPKDKEFQSIIKNIEDIQELLIRQSNGEQVNFPREFNLNRLKSSITNLRDLGRRLLKDESKADSQIVNQISNALQKDLQKLSANNPDLLNANAMSAFKHELIDNTLLNNFLRPDAKGLPRVDRDIAIKKLITEDYKDDIDIPIAQLQEADDVVARIYRGEQEIKRALPDGSKQKIKITRFSNKEKSDLNRPTDLATRETSDELLEAIVKELYLDKNLFPNNKLNKDTLNEWRLKNKEVLKLLPELDTRLQTLIDENIDVATAVMKNPESLFQVKGITRSFDNNGNIVLRIDGVQPNSEIVKLLKLPEGTNVSSVMNKLFTANQDNPTEIINLYKAAKLNKKIGPFNDKELEIVNLRNSIRGYFIDELFNQAGLKQIIDDASLTKYRTQGIDDDAIINLINRNILGKTQKQHLIENNIFTKKEFDMLINQMRNLKSSENASAYLGRYSKEFNLLPVASQLNLMIRIAGANFSSFFAGGPGAQLVIAHAMNQRFARGLERFLQPQQLMSVLDKALTDPKYFIRVMEATNAPVTISQKAKRLRPTLLEAGIDIAEKDLIEEIENNPDLMNNEEYQNLWNAYLKEMRRKK